MANLLGSLRACPARPGPMKFLPARNRCQSQHGCLKPRVQSRARLRPTGSEPIAPLRFVPLEYHGGDVPYMQSPDSQKYASGIFSPAAQLHEYPQPIFERALLEAFCPTIA
jgi:hypothetical protein